MPKLFLIALLLTVSLITNAKVEPDIDSIPKINPHEESIIYAWTIDELSYNPNYLIIDTTINRFQIINPIKKNHYCASGPGGFGNAAISNIFHLRKYNSDFIFFRPHELFTYLPENTIYYNTKKHYSLISYTNSGDKITKGQSVNVFHAQNINPYWNVGINVKMSSSLGQYPNQERRVNSISLFSSYTKNKYSLFFSGNYNKVKLLENGGLTSDDNFESGNIELLNFYFESGTSPKSILANKNVQLVQKFKLGKRRSEWNEKDSIETTKFDHLFNIGHKIRYEDTYRLYSDNYPSKGLYRGAYVDATSPYYYDTLINNYNPEIIPIYIDSNQTFDSVNYKSLRNRIFIELPENTLFKPGAQIAFGYDGELLHFEDYYETNQNGIHFMAHKRADTLLTSSYISFATYSPKEKKLIWRIGAKCHLTGYRQGDLNISGFGQKNFYGKKDTSSLSLNVTFSRSSPDFFENKYFSNHYKWDSTFFKKDRTDILLVYSKPSWKLEVGIYYGILDNFIYYESTGYPSQATGTFNIATVFAKKDFHLWKFRFINRVYYQNVGNSNAVRVPEFVVYNSTYFYHEFRFKSTNGGFDLQLGFDIYYWTKFQGYAYLPETNQFISQYDKEIGGHPIGDVFMTVRLKRVRFFLKFAHLNALFMSNNYYSAYHYPMDGYAMKFGLSWSFYD